MQILVLLPLDNFGQSANIYILRSSRAANSIICDGILAEFKLIQLKALRVITAFLSLLVYGDFSRHSRTANSIVQALIGSNFELIQDYIVVIVTCKNEDPIQNEGARVVTTSFIDFSDAQGQLTPKSVMESCRISNSSKLLWLALLPVRMKKIHIKMKAQIWSQHFSQNKYMGIFLDAQGQLTPQFLVRSCRISNPLKALWLSSLLEIQLTCSQMGENRLPGSQHNVWRYHNL